MTPSIRKPTREARTHEDTPARCCRRRARCRRLGLPAEDGRPAVLPAVRADRVVRGRPVESAARTRRDSPRPAPRSRPARHRLDARGVGRVPTISQCGARRSIVGDLAEAPTRPRDRDRLAALRSRATPAQAEGLRRRVPVRDHDGRPEARAGTVHDLLRRLPRAARQRAGEDLGTRLPRRRPRSTPRRWTASEVRQEPTKYTPQRLGLLPRLRHRVGHRAFRCATCRSGTTSRSSPRGYGGMPSYSAQIPPADRWRIIAYIRVLQMSQHADAAQLPDDVKNAIERGREAVSTDPAATPGDTAGAARPTVPAAGLVELHALRGHRGHRRPRALPGRRRSSNLATGTRRRAASTIAKQRFGLAYLTGYIYWFSLPLGGDGAPDDRLPREVVVGAAAPPADGSGDPHAAAVGCCCSFRSWRSRCAPSTTRRTGGRTARTLMPPRRAEARRCPTGPWTSASRRSRPAST